jgi:Tfp pilus assembly protein PilF
MAEVLLTQAVNEAEEAIESGNYGGAIETCQRILGQFPEFAGAHRIMAEAYAEKGDYEAAREAYQRTLERDPQSIPAHLGLGLLAEDTGDQETALAYVQVAWEIDPRRRDLREHVSRISQALYGADGRLYLTRAALASLHFHAGRWDRAVTEAAQVLQDYPSRIDVQVRLGEALWRRGDDSQAKNVALSILRALPSAVVPLLVLADIYRREGDDGTAQDYLKQARDIDPDGVRASDLIIVGFDDQADFLAVEDIPTIDDQLVHEEPARYAPAPDFTAADADDIPFAASAPEAAEDFVIPSQTEAGAEQTAPDLPEMGAGVTPFRWEDLGDEDLEISDLNVPADDLAAEAPPVADSMADFSLPTDEEIQRARPGDLDEGGYTGMLDSLESQGMEPFDPTGGAQANTPEPARDEFSWDDMTLPTDEELEQARPGEDQPHGYTGMLDSFEAEGIEPFDPVGGGQPPPVDESAQASEEWLGDLGLPSDDEVPPAPAAEQPSGPETDDWLSEFSLPSEDEIQEARPSDERPAGFTGILDELDSAGMEPFDPTGGQTVPEPPEELPPAELEQAATEPEADAALELGDLGRESPFELDWSQIDQEIEEARPGEMPRGYTDELRSLDVGGIEPFAFGESGPPDETTPEAQAMAEGLPGGDDAGIDELVSEWEPARPEDEPESPEVAVEEAGGLDSIGVLFDEEMPSGFAETEPLQADRLSGESGDEPFGAEWIFGEGREVGESAASPFTPSETSDVIDADEFGADLFEVDEGPVSEPPMEPAPVARETSPVTSPVPMNVSAERLGLDEALIERAREAKQALIESGQITGTVKLPGLEVVESVDQDRLRDALVSDPENIDRRIELAHSLLEDSPDEALEHYRWVYRNAPERGAEVVADLARLVEVMREREMGVHRLLGALYRRHGDWAAAATHYEESLSGRLSRRHSR